MCTNKITLFTMGNISIYCFLKCQFYFSYNCKTISENIEKMMNIFPIVNIINPVNSTIESQSKKFSLPKLKHLIMCYSSYVRNKMSLIFFLSRTSFAKLLFAFGHKSGKPKNGLFIEYILIHLHLSLSPLRGSGMYDDVCMYE